MTLSLGLSLSDSPFDSIRFETFWTLRVRCERVGGTDGELGSIYIKLDICSVQQRRLRQRDRERGRKADRQRKGRE